MILQYNCIENDFTIRMHWKWFYYANALGKDFTIKMHWKGFYYKNALEMILQ